MEENNKKSILDKVAFNSPVILGFAFISLIVLILGYITKDYTTTKFFCVYKSKWSDPTTFIRLFGHVLGHANLQHYVNNMMLLLLLGPLVEEKYGSKKLLIMILITAFVTGIVNVLFFNSGLLGASGVVFMLIILSAASVMKDDKIPFTLILVVILYIGDQVYSGLFTKDNISQFTHVLGGLCGGVFGFELKTKNK